MSLNPIAYSSGDKCIIDSTPSGGTMSPLPGRDWTLTIKGNNKDVSNSRDGRKRIPGLPDAEGELKMPYDTGNDPTTAASGGIKSGAVTVLKLYTDATHFYSLSAIIDEIGPGVEFEGELMFPVKFSLESGSSLTYPVYP